MSAVPRKVYLEDLAAGTTFAGSGTIRVTREEIISFASRYDPQAFHLSETDAEKSFFGELVASGWHTACMTMRMLVEGELQFEGGMIGTWGEITWPAPVKPGDELQVKGEVIEILPSRSVAGHGFVLIKTETVNQHGKAVQRMSARLMIRSRNPTGK